MFDSISLGDNFSRSVIGTNIFDTLSLSTSVIAPQFQWYLNNVVLQNAIQSILIPAQNGSYKWQSGDQCVR
jgi:hypothetical protein